MKRLFLSFVIALWALPAAAQTSLLPTLERMRAEYPTPMSREQLGELLNRVAWEHRAEGWGLLQKGSGNSCPAPQGVYIACDILIHAPSIQHFDVLIDAENAAAPTWRNVGPCVIGPSSGCAMSNYLAPIGAAGSPRFTRGDFDGDGKADLTIFRPTDGRWYTRRSATGGNMITNWGAFGDIPVLGDYDGDGISDLAVFRASTRTWYFLSSSSSFSTGSGVVWGESGDMPVAADFDGDGRTDLVVYRPSNGFWYVLFSSTGYSYATAAGFHWGIAGDLPVSADFDGDGRTDLAVFRPSTGTWWILASSTNFTVFGSFQWGASGDVPLTGDFDQDGKADLIVYRPSNSTWYGLTSSSGYTAGVGVQWGRTGDLPVALDFDGDGFPDIAVFRPATGEWFMLGSASRYTTAAVMGPWGISGDVPVPLP